MNVNEPQSLEAITWLNKNINHRLATTLSHHQSVELVENLYILGAVEIVAYNILKNEHGDEMTNKILIILPRDKMLRAELFRWYNNRVVEMGWAKVSDTNQDYLVLLLP